MNRQSNSVLDCDHPVRHNKSANNIDTTPVSKSAHE